MSYDIDEADVTLRCIHCGETISADVDRSFTLGAGSALCCACAEERGGIYDPVDDRWALPPDLPEHREG